MKNQKAGVFQATKEQPETAILIIMFENTNKSTSGMSAPSEGHRWVWTYDGDTAEYVKLRGSV